MADLFTLGRIPKGNKAIFEDVISSLPNGSVIRISPFTDHLRQMGASISESSTERYLRFCRYQWNFGVTVKSEGRGCYRIERI